MNRNILYQLFCFIILKKLWNQLLGKKVEGNIYFTMGI